MLGDNAQVDDGLVQTGDLEISKEWYESGDKKYLVSNIKFKGKDYKVVDTAEDGYILTDIGKGTPIDGDLKNPDHTNKYFKISKNGLLTAHNALIYGTIYANAGQIGGCSIKDGLLEVPVANISGKLTASNIDATNLKVNAANIEGKLIANQIDATNLKIASGNVTGTFTASKIQGGTLSGLIFNVSSTDGKNGGRITFPGSGSIYSGGSGIIKISPTLEVVNLDTRYKVSDSRPNGTKYRLHRGHEEISFVTGDGRTIKGYIAYWSTDTNAN
jgi:hypothetical protein